MAMLGSKLEDVYQEVSDENISDDESEVEDSGKEMRKRRNPKAKKRNKTLKKNFGQRRKTRRSQKNHWGPSANHLANSNMPPHPQITREPDEVKEDFSFGTFEDGSDDEGGEAGDYSPSDFSNNFKSNYSNVTESYVNENSDYYNNGDSHESNIAHNTNYIPNYTKLSGDQRNLDRKDRLMEKLNYMIHLLEEQQDESTNNINEELILYMFLGVFVIFVVDSFSQSKHYVR